MSAAVAYDTLKIARQLTQAGLEPKVAEGVSEAFAGVLAEREDALATKTDVSRLEARMGQIESVLRTEIQSARHESLSEFRAVLADQTRWMLMGMLAIAGLLFAAIWLTGH